MSDLKFRIKAKSENATKTVVQARGFEIIIDEPKALGGNDAGANPVEYILAALSGCLNVVGHMIAKELNFELRGIEISMNGDINVDRLFGTSRNERAGYKNIEVMMKLDCDASPEILSKWLKLVEDRCPVSDNIGNATPINFKLKKTHQIVELN